MTRSTDDQEKRLTELKKEVPKRGFDRYTSRLKNISELPIELQSAVVTAFAARETIQTILVFPPQIQRGWHYVPKQALLFTASGMAHLLASIWQGEEPRVTSLKGCNLMYMKVTLVLLYGFLEILAQGESEPVRLSVEFNTVDWYRISSPLQCFLENAKTTANLPVQPANGNSPTAQRAFEELPIKFSNGLKIHGLLPGEELEEFVFQPSASKRWLYFFQRPVSANTLLALTSHYMVVIEEELNVKQGWVISYIPRNNIIGIQNQPCDLWNELAVQLKREDQSIAYKLTLKNETVETWRRAWVQQGGAWEELPVQQA